MKRNNICKVFLSMLIGCILISTVVSADNAEAEYFNRVTNSRNQLQEIDKYFLENGSGQYPDYFAGMYLDDVSGNLVLSVTEKNDEIVNVLTEISNHSSIIIKEGAQFSYQELNEFASKILAELTQKRDNNLPGVWDTLSLIGIDEQNNTLRIGLTSNGNSREAEFLEWAFSVIYTDKKEQKKFPVPNFATYEKISADIKQNARRQGDGSSVFSSTQDTGTVHLS